MMLLSNLENEKYKRRVLRVRKKFLFIYGPFSRRRSRKILSTIVNHLNFEKYDVDILEIEHFDKDMNEGVRITKTPRAGSAFTS